MHSNSDDSDFMKTVDEIRSSEEQADRIKADAKEKSEQILKKAKESVLKIRNETEEEVVKLKNKLLKAGKDKIESEVEEILSGARTEADGFKKEKLKDSEILSLLKETISES
jgi:vacuolar-type H+-ATPase subunit H